MRLLVLFALTLCATKPDVVAIVSGRPIPRSEIRPSDATLVTAEEKARLRQKIWCELARAYVDAHHLAPTAGEVKAYAARTKDDPPLCTTRGLRDPAADLSTTILDRIASEQHAGSLDDARQFILDEAQRDRTVQIVDPAYTGALDPIGYTTRSVNSPDQVRVDCANGFSFVVRRRDDGHWYEETKTQAGVQKAFASVADAATERCAPR